MDDTKRASNPSSSNHSHDSQRIEELEHALRASESARQAAETRWQAAERELEDLGRFLSHDLRAPLRGIDGYSKALVEDYGGQLDNMALAYLHYISESGQLAAAVVEKLIHYIRVPRAAIEVQGVDLSELAQEILERLHSHAPERPMETAVTPELAANTDPRLARLLLEILLENAWKFTGKQTAPRIEFGRLADHNPPVYCVRDNGAGFNPAYLDQLFQPFRRLHSAHEFEGAGMGLAVARRIVERLGGRIWAEGETGQGATFYFTLEPENSQ